MGGRMLGEGLELRAAVDGDVDQIAALVVERGDPSDGVDLRLMVEDPDVALDAVAVVVDGSRVVSTATLLDQTVRVRYPGGQLELAAGQVEFVATDTAYEGRGFVRALMAWAHERSAAQGHDLQVMVGIPYFYRLFGYEYAIDIPPARRVGEVPSPPDGVVVRPACADDIGAIDRLQDAAQVTSDVTMPRSAAEWRWVLGGDSSTTWVTERGGTVVAAGRASGDDGDVLLTEVAAVDRASVDALLHGVGAEAEELVVAARPWVASLLSDVLAPADGVAEQYYVRLPDPGAVLERWRSVFSARLLAAGIDRSGHDAVISTFGAHYRMAITDDGVGPVRVGGPMQAPGAAGGCGVAPDALPALLTGPHGMHGLARRRPDVYPGGDTELLCPAEVVEAVVVDAGGVGELVDHRDVDLFGKLVDVVAQLAQWQPEDADHVGALVPRALGVRHTLVQPEQLRVVGMPIRNLHDDVVQHARQLIGEIVEGVGDEPLEPVSGKRVHRRVRRPSARD